MTIAELNHLEESRQMEKQIDLHRELLEQKDRQLLCARYTFHKVTQAKYKEMSLQGMPKELANEHYKRAMANYDSIVAGAIKGSSCEANQADMDKGFD